MNAATETHIHLHVHEHHDDGSAPILAEILKRVKALQKETHLAALDLSELQTEVARESDLIAAAKKAFQGLADQIDATAGNPAALKQLTAQMRAQDDDFAQAIVANTPAAAGTGTGNGGGTPNPAA